MTTCRTDRQKDRQTDRRTDTRSLLNPLWTGPAWCKT